MHVQNEGKGTAGTVLIFDIASSAIVGSEMVHPDAVGAVAFAPDSGKLVTGCRDGLIRLWDVAKGIVEQSRIQPGWKSAGGRIRAS
jgi:WD40 repeat protein